jgi:AcrR family transcriptional regulator
MEMRDDRLGPADWVTAGLQALETSGFTALKADTLAKTLGVSRGSFYWHFTDVSAFQVAILQRWREIELENIVAEIERVADDRLDALLRRAFLVGSRLEIAVRAWATADAQARAVVVAVDAERVGYLSCLLIDEGVDTAVAGPRAQIINWTYLGFALSSPSVGHRALRKIITDLSNFARSNL